jgi:hypothetical protein
MVMNKKIAGLETLGYDTLMTLLESQVRKVINLWPNPHEMPNAEAEVIASIMAAALPLNNGNIEVKDPQVASFLELFLQRIIEEVTKSSEERSKVVSIWEEN